MLTVVVWVIVPKPWVLLSGMLNASEESNLLASLQGLSCELGWKQSRYFILFTRISRHV